MSLINCPYCSTPVSDTAIKCPNCGGVSAMAHKKSCPECGSKCNASTKDCPKCGYDFDTIISQKVPEKNEPTQTVIQNTIVQKNKNSSGCVTLIIILIVIGLIAAAAIASQGRF